MLPYSSRNLVNTENYSSPLKVVDKVKEFPTVDSISKESVFQGKPITEKIIVKSHYQE